MKHLAWLVIRIANRMWQPQVLSGRYCHELSTHALEHIPKGCFVMGRCIDLHIFYGATTARPVVRRTKIPPLAARGFLAERSRPSRACGHFSCSRECSRLTVAVNVEEALTILSFRGWHMSTLAVLAHHIDRQSPQIVLTRKHESDEAGGDTLS